MRSALLSRGILIAAICLAVCAPHTLAQSTANPTPSTPAQPPVDFDPNDPERQQAEQFYAQHKMPEAVALLEKVVARYPKDMAAHERLGAALLHRAEIQTEPEKRRADRRQARAELLRARELGDTSDLCTTFLAAIPEDGSESPFSDKAEVDAAMRLGEAAFAKGEWEQAVNAYSHALELDPKLYLAAVNIGDTYFRQERMDKAGEWFARAIQIDSDEEIAYRYWGDALLTEGKMKEARAKFIEGLAANPYRPTSWNGLRGWLSRNHLKFQEIPIQLPAGPTTGPKGETTINIDPATFKRGDSTGAAWMAYPMERALWRGEKFAKEYPQEKTYRHSLKEETAALSRTAIIFHQLQEKKKDQNPDAGLLLLSQFQAEGLLEPYILLIKPDKEIAQDYPAYRAAHREKLIEFADKYLVPPAP